MVKFILLMAGLLGRAAVADDAPRDVTYTLANDCPKGGCRVPGFDKGYLFELKPTANYPPDGLAVFDPAGRRAFQVDIIAPDGSPGHLNGNADRLAADSDGTILVPIYYGGYGGNGHVKGGGIVVLNGEGRQVRFVDTGRFLPDAACFGQDHSIWVMGRQYTPLRDGDPQDHVERGDYNLVRKYSPDGKLLGSFLARSLFPRGLSPSAAGWMRASNDRIGVMTYPGDVSNNPEWIELDSNGKLMGRWKLGPRSTVDPDTHHIMSSLGGFAFTLDGRLFAQLKKCVEPLQCSYQVMLLDRGSSTWKSVDGGAVDPFRYLMAANGNSLVFVDRNPAYAGGGVRMVWVQPGQPRTRPE